jgi:hypothetical protein
VSIGLIAFIAIIVFFQYAYPKIRGKQSKKDRTVILE